MKPTDIKRGDVCGTRNPMALGRGINAVQWLWSRDNESKYSHSLMFLDSERTFEALWTNKSQDFLQTYRGKRVIIARPLVSDKAKDRALKQLTKRHSGQRYPFWRIPMHIFPPLAKICAFERLVCSELTAKYLWLAGARHEQYAGTNCDTLADEWRCWGNFEIIYEGML